MMNPCFEGLRWKYLGAACKQLKKIFLIFSMRSLLTELFEV